MSKLLLILSCSLLINITSAYDMSYDNTPITPQCWEEVDLTYNNYINGKKYTEQANLLRPISWIKQNHLDKTGTTVHLTKEQLGIDADVKIVAIKPVKLNYSNINQENTKPVIATFITHSNDVWSYTFQDQSGHTEVIQAVPGHQFYSLERQAFIPIWQFKIGEYAESNNSRIITLINKRSSNKEIEYAYNFEVYQRHNYKVGNNNIVVHNPRSRCFSPPSDEPPNDKTNLAKRKELMNEAIKKYAEPYINLKNDSGRNIIFNPDKKQVEVIWSDSVPEDLQGLNINPNQKLGRQALSEEAIKMIAVANMIDDINYYPQPKLRRPVGIREFLGYNTKSEFATELGLPSFTKGNSPHIRYINSVWDNPPEFGSPHLYVYEKLDTEIKERFPPLPKELAPELVDLTEEDVAGPSWK